MIMKWERIYKEVIVMECVLNGFEALCYAEDIKNCERARCLREVRGDIGGMWGQTVAACSRPG